MQLNQGIDTLGSISRTRILELYPAVAKPSLLRGTRWRQMHHFLQLVIPGTRRYAMRLATTSTKRTFVALSVFGTIRHLRPLPSNSPWEICALRNVLRTEPLAQ